MYLTMLKAAVVTALSSVFQSTYPDPNTQGTFVSIEYPIDAQSYPSIWVNYDDTDTVEIAGLDHREFVYDEDGELHEVTRWMFAGEISLTAVALSSRERDNLYDQLVRVFAFSRVEDADPEFRSMLENNDFIAINVNWDQLRPHGDAAAPGTPWGTEAEVIYERSLSFDLQGEFVSDYSRNILVPLRQIVVLGTSDALPVNPAYDNPFRLAIPPQLPPLPS